MAGPDTAVGAILEIPPSVLQDIQKADRYITNLQITSKRAAEAVKTHWGTIATEGLGTFIQKLADAQEKMKLVSGGKIDFNINTQPLENKLNDVSNATKKTATDVSSAVQVLAWESIDFSNLERLKLYFETFPAQFMNIKATIESMERTFSAMTTEDPESQRLANKIQLLREYYDLRKKSEEQLKTKTAVFDQTILDEQKTTLQQILQYRKDINAETTRQERVTKLGGTVPQEDIDRLKDYRDKLDRLTESYKTLKGKIEEMSEAGQKRFNKADIDYELARARELTSAEEKRGQALQMVSKYLSETKLKSAGISSREEGIYMNEQVAVYRQMIELIKKRGEVEAQVASQGYAQTSAQTNLLQTIQTEYDRLNASLSKVTGTYVEIDRAVSNAFDKAKTMQEAENAAKLADAYQKAAQAAEKHGLVLRDTASLESKIQAVTQQINQEKTAWTNVEQKVRDAQAAFDALKNANPNFNVSDAEQKLDSLRRKISDLYTQIHGGLSPKQEGIARNEIEQLKTQYDELSQKLTTIGKAASNLAYAQDDAQNANSRYGQSIAQLEAELKRLEKELMGVRDANASINAEIGKGSTAKSLASEYAKLTKRLQEVNDAMNKFQAAGGNVNSASYRALENELVAIMARRKEIEKMDIAEINQYRLQMNQSAYQQDLSAWIQNEAQKKAASLQAIQETNTKRQEAWQRYLQSYEGAMKQVNALSSGRKSGQYTDTFENRARVIKNLEAAIKSLKTTDADYEKKLKDITDALNRLKSAQDAVKTAMKPVISSQDALNMAKNATTLRELEAAYKALKEAMANTKASDPQWAAMNAQLQKTKTAIDDIKKKMGEFQSQAQRTSNMMNQLQGRIAAAFSIGAINGFIKKMVEVRAQFELQRVALGAILQDKDKANKIFLEVQQMALQSPFTIMQLERATKQIAAFGFEADKLKPTLKMLADMSAGLGVEIDRLVLVMGHLRARNYLEGTMVRQFTNAGFNILGELAKYYTELEGRMVSVAEVQSRVKKKMVEFGDVEEVLKRVTSAGGMFYDMQKKQSESLYGQMQRISDAYDLMLNEIGKDNQNMIAKALTLIRTMISHWRMLAPILKEIGYLMAGIMAVKGIIALTYQMNKLGIIVQTLATQWRLVGLAAGKAATSMKLAWASTGIGALIAGVVTAIAVLQGLNAEAKALNEEMGRIGEDSVRNLNESIAQFKLLADVMGDSAKTYTERKDAMKEMKRVYAEILPQEKMEIGYIESLKGNYSELLDTISEYYRAKEYQQKYEAVMNSQQAQEVQKEIERAFKRMNKDQTLGLIFSDTQLKAWSEKLANELNTGKLPNAIDSIKKRVQEMFPDAKNVERYFEGSYDKADFTDVQDKVEKVRDAFGDISLATANAENALAMYNEQIGRMDFGQLESEQEKIVVKLRQIKTSLDNINRLPQTSDKDVLEQRAKMIAQLTAEYENYFHALDSVAEAKGKVLAKEFYDEIESETKQIQAVYREYWQLGLKMRDLKTQGKELTPEFARLKKEQDKCGKSADELVEKYRLGNDMSVSKGFLDATETSYELGEKMKQLAQRAFPTLAEKAQENIDKFEIALLKGEKTWWGFLNSLKSILPEGWTKEWGDIAAKIGATESEIEALSGKAGPAANKVDTLSDSMGRLYSDISKDVAKKYGANFERLNTIMSDSSKVAKDMATELRNEAKTLNETTKAYDAAKKKGQAYVDSFLKGQQKTAEEIEQMKKDAQAFTEAADRLWIDEKKKGGKGKDPILELWKKRIKALQDYYTAREKARKNLSVPDAEKQQRLSFEQLWKELGFDTLKGLSLNELIAQGFDPKKLQTDLVSSLEQLKKLIPDKYQDVKKEIESVIAKEKIEIQFKVKEGEREQLQKSITEMFDNYALTKELSKLGVSVDLTYMVGGKPTTLDDIRKKYEELMVGFASKSKEDQKIIKKMGEDLMKKEYDNRKQQLINYNKFLLESMSERVQIEMKAMREINRLRDDETLDETTRLMAIRRENEKLQKDLASQEWKAFQGSDLYIQLFENIEQASTQSINYVLQKLRSLRDSLTDLPADQMKVVMSQIDKLEKQVNTRNPFKALKDNIGDAIKAYRKLGQASKDFQDASERYENAKKNRDDYALGTTALEEQLQIQRAKLGVNEDGEQIETHITRELEEQLKERRANLALMNEEVDALDKEKNGLSKVVAGFTKSKEAAGQALQKIGSWMSETSSAIGDIATSLENVFGAMSDGTRDTTDSIQSIISGTVDMLSGVGRFMAGDYIGGSLQALKGLASTVGAIFAIGDKKKERDIQKLVEKVDTLDKAYQRLEKSIEKAYTFSDYNAGYKQMQQNLDSQKQAYEEMIRLEEAKKKTDDAKIKEYKEKLQDIADAQDELRKQRHEMYGSTDDFWSEANSWVDAWLDAYKEAGSGLDSLNESWDEFYENLVKKQATSAIVSKRMEKFIDQINKAIEANTTEYGYVDAFKDIGERFKKEFGDMNQQLIDFFNYAGITGGKGELILSDLQKGIQTITEPQAAAIESYLNSMRFAVFTHTEQLERLIATVQAQYGSGAENPVVTELKGIRGVLDNIYKDLHSVINTQGRNATLRIGAS